MNKVWMCSGSTYTQVGSGYKVSESLPVGIYGISLTMTGYHLVQKVLERLSQLKN